MFHARIDSAEVAADCGSLAIDRHAVWSALAIAAAAVVLRWGLYGNPITGLDEQFYLLVGDRMWAGTLPYVDVWDRKPVGLFLLFAAIRLLPGDGVLAAQIVATGFAAATGWLVALLARRWTGWLPATGAAIVYIAAAGQLWAGTTQTPVFFNAFVAAAALLTWQASCDPHAHRRRAMLAIGLCGMAVQIKTNAVFPGIYFAGWLLWRSWRTRRDAGQTLSLGAGLLALGALPTLAVVAWYAGMGHLDAWWQANVASILAKGRVSDAMAIDSLWGTVILTAPVLVLAGLGLWWRTGRFTRCDAETLFMIGWVAMGVVDFAALGGYFPHYAMPLVLACTPFVAVAFAINRWTIMLLPLTLAWPIVDSLWLNAGITARERRYAETVTAALPRDVRTRCLFIYEGPPIYYHLTHACWVSPYVFTAHLSSRREAASLGTDPLAALDRAMARQPGTVLTVVGSRWPDRNLAAERRLAAWLGRDYRLVRLLPYRSNPGDGRLAMWRRVQRKL